VGAGKITYSCKVLAHCEMCGTFSYEDSSKSGETLQELEERLLFDYKNQLKKHRQFCNIARTLKIYQGRCEYCDTVFEKLYRLPHSEVNGRKIEDIENAKLYEFHRECRDHTEFCFREHSKPRIVLFEKSKKY